MSRRYTLTNSDRVAIYKTAKNLGVDPYEFTAVLEQESGVNPNIWGGQGGDYYGLIQFGKSERKEAGLDPKKIGNYTVAEQMPHAEKWLKSRGFQPGMPISKLYATILGGNPDANIYAKDSFGTSVADSLGRFYEGGKLNKIAKQKLGDLPEENLTVNNYYSIEQTKEEKAKNPEKEFEQLMLGRLLSSSLKSTPSDYGFSQLLQTLTNQSKRDAARLMQSYDTFYP